jgi:hypothetical protein
VVASVVAKLSILEFAVAIHNDLSRDLLAEKIIEGLGFGSTARPYAGYPRGKRLAEVVR